MAFSALLHSSNVVPKGFSEKTCSPAFNAFSIWSQCRCDGEHRNTASNSLFSIISSKSVYPYGTPHFVLTSSTLSPSIAQIAVNSASGILKAMFSACWIPSLPRPTIPNLIFFIIHPPKSFFNNLKRFKKVSIN